MWAGRSSTTGSWPGRLSPSGSDKRQLDSGEMGAQTPTVPAMAADPEPPAGMRVDGGQVGQVAIKTASRLAGVDGLRAAAAFWVVLFHIRVFSGVHLPIQPLDFFVRSGSTGVSLFLVLSGFCLYLPFAAGKQGRFKTGSFFVRRARRLLPAYYCSLGLALALNVIGGGNLGFGPLSPRDVAVQLATHLTMVHTLFTWSFYALNGAYWSLGLEWQLYLALPLLIVGMRRFGLVPTLAAAVIVNADYRVALASGGTNGLVQPGILQSVVLPNLLPGRWPEFVFGMVVAELYAGGKLDRLPRLAHYAWVPLT